MAAYRIRDNATGELGTKTLTREAALAFIRAVRDRYGLGIAERYEIVEDL